MSGRDAEKSTEIEMQVKSGKRPEGMVNSIRLHWPTSLQRSVQGAKSMTGSHKVMVQEGGRKRERCVIRIGENGRSRKSRYEMTKYPSDLILEINTRRWV